MPGYPCYGNLHKILYTPVNPTWRFMGGYKWGYKSLNMGCKYSYPTYNPTYDYP